MNKHERAQIIKAVAAELRAARARCNITQDELAKKSGVSKASICRFETGERTPKLPQLFLLCSALGIEPTQIIRGL